MSAIDETLLNEILSLSPDQRSALIDMLIESLNLPIEVHEDLEVPALDPAEHGLTLTKFRH